MAIFHKSFFDKKQTSAVVAAIQEAEKNTSGEIRVHLESKCSLPDTFARGTEVFAELKMHKTQQRNGVLFYLATEDRKFAIVADEGINKLVPIDFWDTIKNKMQVHFKEKRFVAGLQEGINLTGEYLKKYFPYQTNDTNELSDEISMGD
jgi:uncharacterized membrane protein